MKCWRCGNEIIDASVSCVFCGSDQKRLPALTSEGKALRNIYDRFGCEAVLTNSSYLTNALGDILPDSSKLKNWIASAMHERIGDIYLTQIKSVGYYDSDFENKVLKILIEDAGLSDNVANNLMGLFNEMIGWGGVVDKSNSQSEPKDKNKTEENNKEKKKTSSEGIKTTPSAKSEPRSIIYKAIRCSDFQKSNAKPIVIKEKASIAAKGFDRTISMNGNNEVFRFDPYPEHKGLYKCSTENGDILIRFELQPMNKFYWIVLGIVLLITFIIIFGLDTKIGLVYGRVSYSESIFTVFIIWFTISFAGTFIYLGLYHLVYYIKRLANS